MTANAALLSLRVTQARLVAPRVRELRLARDGAGPLPSFQAGAHVRVKVVLPDGAIDWRHYSLVAFDSHAMQSPAEYVLAIHREASGRGGSSYLHDRVAIGDTLEVEPPKNDFPVGDHVGAAVLVAGGIGVTPLTAMAAQRLAADLPVRMVFAGRSRAALAYLEPLHEKLGDRLQIHADDEAGGPLGVAELLDRCAAPDVLYVCGPAPMLEAVQHEAAARGWPRERVHFELFATATPATGDRAFTVVLASSGRTLEVGPQQTLLQCLIDSGCDPMFDCQRGECGVCAVPVLDGAIDHRDFVLSAREKAAGNVIQTCVSRAAGARLVLDI